MIKIDRLKNKCIQSSCYIDELSSMRGKFKADVFNPCYPIDKNISAAGSNWGTSGYLPTNTNDLVLRAGSRRMTTRQSITHDLSQSLQLPEDGNVILFVFPIQKKPVVRAFLISFLAL